MAFDDVPGLDETSTEILVVNVASEGGPKSYERGDIVVARPENWPWGRFEDPETRRAAFDVGIAAASPREKFVILKINGRDFATGRGLGDSFEDATSFLSKSRFAVDLDGLPRPVREDLTNNGKASISLQQFSNSLTDKAEA